MENDNFDQKILSDFLDQDLNALSYQKDLSETDYNSSKYRIEKYKNLPYNDEKFQSFLTQIYGSVDNFFDFNQELTRDKLYNPESDYIAEVTVITSEEYYKTNFISSIETFFEIVGGICTIEYFKVDGRAAKIIGTLQEKYIPSSQQDARVKSFKYAGSERILVWDLQKQGWSSFYMNNLRRFVKDDTSGLQ